MTWTRHTLYPVPTHRHQLLVSVVVAENFESIEEDDDDPTGPLLFGPFNPNPFARQKETKFKSVVTTKKVESWIVTNREFEYDVTILAVESEHPTTYRIRLDKWNSARTKQLDKLTCLVEKPQFLKLMLADS